MKLEKWGDFDLTKMLVGRPIERDEFWITVVKYHWNKANRSDAAGYVQTPEGGWERFEPGSTLRPTMTVSGLTVAYADPSFERELNELVKQSRWLDDARSQRIVDTLRRVLA